MNKLAYFAKFLAYAISNPNSGKEVFKTKFQSMQDSKIIPYNYSSKQQNLDQVIDKLFTNSVITTQNGVVNTQKLREHISDFFNNIRPEKYPSKKKPYPAEYSIDDKSGLFLYLLCKITEPKQVVETGVAYGLSSMYILQALEENKKGSLHSIDGVFSPWQTRDMIGAAIPSDLKNRWNFNFGSSEERLGEVLSSLESVDIFLHDSLHTYNNMMFEFDTAWPYLSKGGFLISDDINDNNAFYDFCTKMHLEFIVLEQKTNSYLGIAKKP